MLLHLRFGLKASFRLVRDKIRGDAGVGFILIIACSLIIAAFVILPGLRSFANGIIVAMNNWWTTSISPTIFPSS